MTVDDVARLVKGLTPEQRARVVHVRDAPFEIYIGCAFLEFAASRWGNPFPLRRESGRKIVLRRYVEYLLAEPDLLVDVRELRGKTLGCWCRRPGHDVLCHGLVLLALAEG
jgi:hypothetical protein